MVKIIMQWGILQSSPWVSECKIYSWLDVPTFTSEFIFVFVFVFALVLYLCLCRSICSCLYVRAFTAVGFPRAGMQRTWNGYFPHTTGGLCSKFCIVKPMYKSAMISTKLLSRKLLEIAHPLQILRQWSNHCQFLRSFPRTYHTIADEQDHARRCR